MGEERARAHAIKKKIQQDSRARARAWREKNKQTAPNEYDINGKKLKKRDRPQFSSKYNNKSWNKKSVSKYEKLTSSNPEKHDTTAELNEANQILAEISKPVGIVRKNTVEHDDNNSEYVSNE